MTTHKRRWRKKLDLTGHVRMSNRLRMIRCIAENTKADLAKTVRKRGSGAGRKLDHIVNRVKDLSEELSDELRQLQDDKYKYGKLPGIVLELYEPHEDVDMEILELIDSQSDLVLSEPSALPDKEPEPIEDLPDFLQ